MRNRQEILGAIFGDLEKKFERGVIDILCARDRPDPEALVTAIQEHTLRRMPNGDTSRSDAIDVIIDALELCYYHRDCATFRFALERAKALRLVTPGSAGEPLPGIDLLQPGEACQAEWRQRVREPVAPPVGSDEQKPDGRGSSGPGLVYPLRLRAVTRN